MTLETFFLVTVSLAAILVCVVASIIIVFAAWMLWRMKRLADRVEKIADSTSIMAASIREFVHLFLTAQGIRQVAHHIAHAWHTLKDNKRKESHDSES